MTLYFKGKPFYASKYPTAVSQLSIINEILTKKEKKSMPFASYEALYLLDSFRSEETLKKNYEVLVG